mmetsp:Transcript_25984/g.53169  ORF Transcript_25984/g.53169 Transcript_25984/m.53169 type:complete len:86 (-) Transcript_25984:280-537(-)
MVRLIWFHALGVAVVSMISVPPTDAPNCALVVIFYDAHQTSILYFCDFSLDYFALLSETALHRLYSGAVATLFWFLALLQLCFIP